MTNRSERTTIPRCAVMLSQRAPDDHLHVYDVPFCECDGSACVCALPVLAPISAGASRRRPAGVSSRLPKRFSSACQSKGGPSISRPLEPMMQTR